ncbi:MAG: NUDIX hydrolase [Candidatus Levybacteria bacterium]|nr:NUDIX hydrolase [Candidatus Levybacteria bacterium]
MLYEKRPSGFKPENIVSGCFVEFDGRLLLLKRWPDKRYGGKWGIPGGKSERGEAPRRTAIRETGEEAGIDVGKYGLRLARKTYVRFPDQDFVYNIFQARLTQIEPVTLSNEHVDSVWATPLEALEMDLIMDLDACINMLYIQSGQMGLSATLDTPQGLC